MLGMPREQLVKIPAPAPTPPVPAPAPAGILPGAPPQKTPDARGPAKTMLGMPMPVVAPAPVAAPPVAAGAIAPTPFAPQGPAAPAPPAQGRAPVAPDPSHRTMLGMPIQQVQAPVPPGPGPGPAPAQQAPSSSAPQLGPTNRTMLGVAAPPLAPAPGAAPAAAPGAMPAAAQSAWGSDVSMSGVSAPGASYDDLDRPRKKGGSGVLIVVALLVLVLLVAAVGGGAYFYLHQSKPSLHAQVVRTETGDALQIDVPGAAAGSKVRFGGAEVPLVGGHATFPLAADALHAGDNDVAVGIVAPNGSVESSSVRLTLAYRVRADLGGLAADTPTIAIVVDVPPATRVTVDGQAVALDARGHGTHTVALAPLITPSATVVEHTARYRIELAAGPEQGQVSTRVPVTTLVVDRPGSEVVTDHPSVELAGAVDAGATLTLDGTSIPVSAGRFLHTFAMPATGTFRPVLVARAPGKAPRTVTLSVRRVADLAAEARSFAANPAIDYARLQPNPNIYRGEKIALEGRVYNVDVQGGRSVLQILVRECPRGQRCPLWVTYPAATDATVNAWVRVLGTVAGEQQFRSESNRVITVPRVDAAFVLPARP